MSLSRQNRMHTAALDLVERVSQSPGTVSRVWGGYAADIYLGRILREYDDLDVQIHRLQSKIAAAFLEDGWQTKHLSHGDLEAEDYAKTRRIIGRNHSLQCSFGRACPVCRPPQQ